jgi:hypothetical protein
VILVTARVRVLFEQENCNVLYLKEPRVNFYLLDEVDDGITLQLLGWIALEKIINCGFVMNYAE